MIEGVTIYGGDTNASKRLFPSVCRVALNICCWSNIYPGHGEYSNSPDFYIDAGKTLGLETFTIRNPATGLILYDCFVKCKCSAHNEDFSALQIPDIYWV